MQSGSLYAYDKCGANTLSPKARRFMLGLVFESYLAQRNLPCMTIVQRDVDRSAMFLRRRVPSRSHETCAISTRRAEGARAPCSGPAQRAHLPSSQMSLVITMIKDGRLPRSPRDVRLLLTPEPDVPSWRMGHSCAISLKLTDLGQKGNLHP